jgi:hypothetical protein
VEGDEIPELDNDDPNWHWQDDAWRCHGCKNMIAGEEEIE